MDSAYKRRSMDISIHAPARGATSAFFDTPYLIKENFNPRSRTGSDASVPTLTPGGTSFQSTLPHGERRERANAYTGGHIISIHAPARGATASAVAATTGTQISIHAPARGATGVNTGTASGRMISIHAPARGATNQVYPSPPV